MLDEYVAASTIVPLDESLVTSDTVPTPAVTVPFPDSIDSFTFAATVPIVPVPP